MSDASEIKTEIERGLRAYRAFENADKVLSYMANLEQQERELVAKIAGLHSVAATAEAESAQRIANAGARAIEAEATALRVGAEAEGTAAALVKSAEDKAASIVKAAKQKVVQAEEEAVIVRREVKAMRDELEAGRTELGRVEASIVRARDQIKTLLKA